MCGRSVRGEVCESLDESVTVVGESKMAKGIRVPRTPAALLSAAALAAVGFAAVAGGACAFEHHTNGITPSANTTGGGGGGGASTGSMIGTWWAGAVASLPSIPSCGDF